MAMDVGGTKGGLKADINVTPLVDVMLVLLIIMMLVAPMLQKGVDVKLPLATNTADKPESDQQTVLAVDARDKFYVNSIEVSRAEMADRVKAALEERFGTSDKAEIREHVVADREALVWLEGLLHPRVMERTEAWLGELAQRADAPSVAVNEVPLLYEVGGEERFDAVVVVTASPEVRVSRQFRPMQDREQRLLSDEDKLARADFSFVNDGSLEDLDAFVADVVGRLSSEVR